MKIAEVTLSFEDWVLSGFESDRAPGAPRPPWWEACHPFKQLERAGPHLDAYFLFNDRERWWPTLSDDPMPHYHKVDTPYPDWTYNAIHAVARFQADTIERFGFEPPEILTP